MPQPKPARLSFSDYLDLEEAASQRHELIDGQLVAMTGATAVHNLITLGLAFALRQQLRGRGCQVFSENLKLRVGADENSDSYYPDVMVVCDRTDKEPLFKTHPQLLAEVLSPNSLRQDRISKSNAYRSIESLQVYLILSQERPLIEMYSRANGWQRQTFDLDDTFAVPGLECQLSVREVYGDVLDAMGI